MEAPPGKTGKYAAADSAWAGCSKACPKGGVAFNVNNFCKNWGGKQLKSGDYGSRMFHGLQLVRRVAKGSKWHPQNDDLRGTAKYGTPPTNPTSGPTGTMQWDYKKVQYFMFSTGDFSEWYVVGALQLVCLTTIWLTPQRVCVLAQDDCKEGHD